MMWYVTILANFRFLNHNLQVVELNGDGVSEEVYKIEIPANRYDLLCVEGLCRAFRIFLKKFI